MPACCTPDQLAQLAQELCAGENESDVRCRASCSRAYYAAYHALEPLLQVVPGSPEGVGAQGGLKHREVPRRLRSLQRLPMEYARLRRYATDGKVAALTYQSALDARERADYLMNDLLAREDAEDQLGRMSQLLEFAQLLRSEFERLENENADTG